SRFYFKRIIRFEIPDNQVFLTSGSDERSTEMNPILLKIEHVPFRIFQLWSNRQYGMTLFAVGQLAQCNPNSITNILSIVCQRYFHFNAVPLSFSQRCFEACLEVFAVIALGG